jgi:predicted ribosomally synthesized peptide with nif11-like leader
LYNRAAPRRDAWKKGELMTANAGDSASQLIDRLVNDAQFRDSLEAAPTLHAKAQVVRAAGYGDVSLDAIQAAVRKQLAALGAVVQVDPERAKRVEELFLKAATDQELQQALQAAATPEAKREVLAQAGYGDITLDDLRAAAADLAQREELSDEELQLVSGGVTGPYGDSTAAAVIPGAITMGAALGSMAGPAGTVVGSAVGLLAGTIIAAVQVAPPPSEW